MWQAGEDACTITGVGFIAEAATMHHAAVDVARIVNNGMAGATLDVAYEADAAALVLVTWVVEASGIGQADGGIDSFASRRRHFFLLFLFALS